MEVILQHEDVFVKRSEHRLVIGNSRIVREFDLSQGAPRTISLQDAAGRQFAAPDKHFADLSFIGLHTPDNPATPWRLDDISAEAVAGDIFDSARVRVVLSMTEPVGQTSYRREYLIYPGLAAIAVQNSVRSPVMPNIYWTERGIYREQQRLHLTRQTESCADGIACAEGFRPSFTAEFSGITDYTDELVKLHRADTEKLNGNILCCENTAEAGFLYLQEAPPSGERRDLEGHDFRLDENEIYSCNWGIHPAELNPETTFQGYRHVLMVYSSAAERDALLKQYLKRRFPVNPQENYSVMVNPWGCGCFPKLVSEEFLLDELKAAGKVGATHYQIDDAWQEGGSLAELTGKNRKITPQFWEISQERLQGSFDRIIAAAAENGVEPGLWMAPSSNCEYRDWEDFARIVLNLHRKYGFRMFKIDAMKIRTYEAEQNLRQMLETVRRETGGEVYFNLDTTNGQRPGYFHFLEYGNIFLENRYVCHTWGVGYHPEKTLRSLWRLARFMRPHMLQIEIPSPEDINPDFYKDKPWPKPDSYPVEYWAGIALFANPLLWFAPSRLSEGLRARIKDMMELHMQYRDRIFAGEIFPVGAEPDGTAITGFQSHNFENGTGMAVFYRELGSSADSAELKLNYLPEKSDWRCIRGNAEVMVKEPGKIAVRISDRPGFAVFTY